MSEFWAFKLDSKDASTADLCGNIQDIFKVLGSLFLPLAIVASGAWLFGSDPKAIMRAPDTYYYWKYALPWLLAPSWQAFKWTFIFGAAAITIFYICPREGKKQVLLALAASYLLGLLHFRATFLYVAALLTLWLGQRIGRNWMLRGAIAAAGLATALLGSFLAPPGRIALAISFTAYIAIKSWSFFSDNAGPGCRPRFEDFALYFTGGFPCGFVTPWYDYNHFTKSFLPTSQWECAKKGILSVYWGLLKLAAGYFIETYRRSLGFSVNFRDLPAINGGYLRGGDLWLLAAILVGVHWMQLIGCYEVIQGLTRIFGFDVENQFNRPWQASSPLDFWRRFSRHNRGYLLKYVVFPAYRLWPSAYATLAAGFIVSALFNFMVRQNWWEAPRSQVHDYAWVLLIFRAGFLGLCFIELAFLKKYPTPISQQTEGGAGRLRRMVGSVATMAAIILLFAPMPAILRLYDTPPNLIPGRTLVGRYCYLYQTMLFPFIKTH